MANVSFNPVAYSSALTNISNTASSKVDQEASNIQLLASGGFEGKSKAARWLGENAQASETVIDALLKAAEGQDLYVRDLCVQALVSVVYRADGLKTDLSHNDLEICRLLFGSVSKTRIPAGEHKIVESLFQNPEAEILVFKVDVSDKDVTALSVAEKTKAILRQSFAYFRIMRFLEVCASEQNASIPSRCSAVSAIGRYGLGEKPMQFLGAITTTNKSLNNAISEAALRLGAVPRSKIYFTDMATTAPLFVDQNSNVFIFKPDIAEINYPKLPLVLQNLLSLQLAQRTSIRNALNGWILIPDMARPSIETVQPK